MFLNLMFFTTRVTKFFILKKLSKGMDIFNSASVIDLTMFVLGILSYLWAWDLRALLYAIDENGGANPIDAALQQKNIDQLEYIVTQDVI